MVRRTPKQVILDNLAAQLNLFKHIQESHDVLASTTIDPDFECLHYQIIDLLGQLREKYTILLNKYNHHSEEPTTEEGKSPA